MHAPALRIADEEQKTQETSGRFRRLVLAFVLALEVVCAGASVALHYRPLLDSRWVQDDAYVSFRYAKHLVEGHGLVYNAGARVEGYTNFLWTLIAAVPLATGADDPLPFMHGAGVALWFGTYLILAILGVSLFREGHWIGPLALIPLTWHWSYNAWFVSAMETPLVSFLVVAMLLLFSADPERYPWSLFWTSLTAMLLLLTRPDAITVVGGIALAGLVLHGRALLAPGGWKIYLLRPALPLLLLYVPYTAWRIAYYGSFYPNTYYVKVAYLTHYERGWEYLRTYLQVYPFSAVLPLALLGVILAPPGAARRYLWGTLAASGLTFFYVVRLGGDFMEWRFVAPITGALYPAAVLGAAVGAQRLCAFFSSLRHRAPRAVPRRTVWPSAAGCFAGVAAAVGLSLATLWAVPVAKERIVPGQENISLLSRYWDAEQFNWPAAGKVLDEILPENVRIATSSAGIVPFFCDRPCIDLCGLTDPDIARRPVDPDDRGRMGHEKCIEDYHDSRKRGVDIYLHWVDPKPFPISLVTDVPEGMEMVSVQLPDGRYTEFVILDNEKVNVDELRKDPRLVFRDSQAVAEASAFHLFREQYGAYVLVDSIDLEDGASQAAHEMQSTEPGHDWHTKMLRYREPDQHLLLHDTGFHVYDIRWKIRGVNAGRPLVMIVRVDRIGRGLYELEVNGRALPQALEFPASEEAWDERAFEIPAELLIEGTNELRLRKATQHERTTEMYYMWFLQPAAPDAPPLAAEHPGTDLTPSPAQAPPSGSSAV